MFKKLVIEAMQKILLELLELIFEEIHDYRVERISNKEELVQDDR